MNTSELQALKLRDPLKWKQAELHLKFKYLCNGFVRIPLGANDVAALLDSSKPQPWRIPPAKGALPRIVSGDGLPGVVPGDSLAGASRTEYAAAVAANPNIRFPFARDSERRPDDDKKTLGTTEVNVTARQLYLLVRPTPKKKNSSTRALEYEF